MGEAAGTAMTVVEDQLKKVGDSMKKHVAGDHDTLDLVRAELFALSDKMVSQGDALAKIVGQLSDEHLQKITTFKEKMAGHYDELAKAHLVEVDAFLKVDLGKLNIKVIQKHVDNLWETQMHYFSIFSAEGNLRIAERVENIAMETVEKFAMEGITDTFEMTLSPRDWLGDLQSRLEAFKTQLNDGNDVGGKVRASISSMQEAAKQRWDTFQSDLQENMDPLIKLAWSAAVDQVTADAAAERRRLCEPEGEALDSQETISWPLAGMILLPLVFLAFIVWKRLRPSCQRRKSHKVRGVRKQTAKFLYGRLR